MPMSDEPTYLVEKAEIETDAVAVTRPRERVAVMTLSSQPRVVLRFAVKAALKSALNDLEADPAVRCVVVTGTGRAFSVGSDIRTFRREAGWLLESEMIENDLCSAIERSRLAVIAACNGYTLGGGGNLALACDIRLAAASARFGFPEAAVGAFASGGATQRLPQLIGRGRALDLLLTGRQIDAAEAMALGLVEGVYPDAELLDRALDKAEAIAASPTSIIAATKRCVSVGLNQGSAAGFALETQLAVEIGLTDDAVEGQRAFVEKRRARFD
jgi:enoyl-CoA hydratase/carnithine racemase